MIGTIVARAVLQSRGFADREVRTDESESNAPKSQAPANFRGPKYRQSVCPRPKLNG
jgi:hypothetical protein